MSKMSPEYQSRNGVSDSYGGSLGVSIPGRNVSIGVDVTRDQNSGEIVGYLRIGVGAGFNASVIECKTRTLILGNYLKKDNKAQCNK